jgi:hypothetical protein
MLLSPKVTSAIAGYGDGLPFEAEAQKVRDTTQPIFKPSHLRLLLSFRSFDEDTLKTITVTIPCPKCGIPVMIAHATIERCR